MHAPVQPSRQRKVRMCAALLPSPLPCSHRPAMRTWRAAAQAALEAAAVCRPGRSLRPVILSPMLVALALVQLRHQEQRQLVHISAWSRRVRHRRAWPLADGRQRVQQQLALLQRHIQHRRRGLACDDPCSNKRRARQAAARVVSGGGCGGCCAAVVAAAAVAGAAAGSTHCCPGRQALRLR